MVKVLILLALCACAFAAPADAPIIREPNVIYLSDFTLPPLKLEVPKPAPSFFQPDLSRYAGTLRAGQQVTVLGIGERAYWVRGQAQQGQVLAWVDPSLLQSLPEGLVDNLRLAEERRRLVADLIKKSEVAIGMTTEEVGLSLGKPQKKTSRANLEGTEDIWEYVRYVSVPQQVVGVGPNGQAVFSTIYVKQPAGTMKVVFDNGIVSSLEQTEGVLLSGSQVTVVPGPILLYQTLRAIGEVAKW